ncbi:MAG: hypothetical protein II885_16995, partial [Oscillospiraceae bacterium]|nr:hypothetical protein [Oscillospiraceae bacterium]
SHSVYNPSQEPPVCFGLYIRQDAAQSYCEVLLYSIDAIYELQECSVFTYLQILFLFAPTKRHSLEQLLFHIFL